MGASGTIKAIGQVCEENGWSDGAISADGLERIRRRLVRAGRVPDAGLKGLREDRMPIFAARGGHSHGHLPAARPDQHDHQ